MGNKEQKMERSRGYQFSDSRITVFELMKNYGENTVLQIMAQVTFAIGNR